MDTENPNPDAPLKAFFSFWWGLAAFAVFGLAALIAFTSSGGAKDKPYAEKIQERLEKRAAVDAAQTEAYAKLSLDLEAAASGASSAVAAKTSKPAQGTEAHAKFLEEQLKAAQALAEKQKAEKEAKEEKVAKTDGDKPKEPEPKEPKDGDSETKPEGKPKTKEAQKITLLPIPNVMQFKDKKLEVKAGQPVELTFNNTDILQHNVLVLKPGTKDKVGALADAMIADPQGMAKGYIPKSDDIIVASKLLSTGQSDTIKFTLDKPGEYPYICTFPGHWRIMNGVITAK